MNAQPESATPPAKPYSEWTEAEKIDVFLAIEHARAGEVSTVEALEIASRYNTSHFRDRMPAGTEEARYSIPADPRRDDDIRLAAFIARAERAFRALDKINGIRNSIIGLQAINWSEHIYPLVAALDEAGLTGMSYDEARPHFASLLERAVRGEERVEALETVIREFAATFQLLRTTALELGNENAETFAANQRAAEKALAPKIAPGDANCLACQKVWRHHHTGENGTTCHRHDYGPAGANGLEAPKDPP